MLRVDERDFRVHIIFPSLEDAFEILEGENSGQALDGSLIRDILGTRDIYTMEIEPQRECFQDFDELYELLSKPVPSHRVRLPYSQTYIEFDAAIYTGRRQWYGTTAGKNEWKHMTVTFNPISPQRTTE